MPELELNALQTACDLRLKLSGLAALLDSVDEYMMKVRVCDPNFNNAMALVLIGIRELEGAKATLDGLEDLIRNLNDD